MDKMMKGRLKIAVLIGVCLVAVFAMTATAYASFASEFPAPGSTLHLQPGAVSVDVLGVSLKSATISVNGTPYKATPFKGTSSGTWAYSETMDVNGVWHGHWTYTPGATTAVTHLSVTPGTVPNGTIPVSVTGTSTSNVAITPDSWSFTMATAASFGAPTPANGATGVSALPTISIPWSAPDGNAYDVMLTVHYNQATQSGDILVLDDNPAPGTKSGVATFVWNMDPLVGAQSVTAQILDSGANVLATKNWSFTVGQGASCITASCHIHGASYATDNAMGPNCQSCHTGNFTPKHTLSPQLGSMGTAHNVLVANLNAGKSKACTACHGAEVLRVATRNAGPPVTYTVPSVGAPLEHQGCSCHLYGEADPGKTCADCHYGAYGVTHGWAIATGPGNSTLLTVGGHNTTTFGTVGGRTAFDGSEGVVVKNSAEDTITQEWPLPTAGVFWSQSSLTGTDSPAVAMAYRGGNAASLTAAVRTDVGWGSIITCEDCHTGLKTNEVNGPHGGSTFAMSGLDPLFPDDWKTAELTTWDPTGMRSVATTVGSSNPYYVKKWVGYANVGHSGGASALTSTTAAGNGYSFGTLPGRFICQKCHKLTDTLAGYPSQNRSGRSQQGQGVSNSAHMEHHPDQILGQANCVSCHISIPHGWKRPRLLVYSSDPAPYVAAQPTTQTVITVGGVSYKGNWSYGTSTAGSSRYIDAIYGGVYTAPAVPGFGKEAVAGYAADGWSQTKEGIEWIAPGTETGANEGQPNCNACSATGGTHTSASEGVPPGAPTWK